jgi:hypothetical protein
MLELTFPKRMITAGTFKYRPEITSIKIEGLENKWITIGEVNGKRVYFLEVIVDGLLESSITFTSISKLLKTV